MNTFFERKNVNIFLPISLNICLGCSKDPSHSDGSFEYPQHMFWLRNKKIIFLVHTFKLKACCIQKNCIHCIHFMHKQFHFQPIKLSKFIINASHCID